MIIIKRLGISIYPNHSSYEDNINYIRQAHEYGFSKIFMCLLSVEGSKSAQAATTSKGSGETTAGQTATTPGMPMQPGMPMEGMSMEGMQSGMMSHGYGYGIHPGMGGMMPGMMRRFLFRPNCSVA